MQGGVVKAIEIGEVPRLVDFVDIRLLGGEVHIVTDLGADVAERGIVLTGGGALLRDIDKLLMEETGLPVVVAEDPLTCVARGGGRALEMMDKHAMDLLSSE